MADEVYEHRHLIQLRELEERASAPHAIQDIPDINARLFLLNGIIDLCSEAKAKGFCCYEDAISIISELNM